MNFDDYLRHGEWEPAGGYIAELLSKADGTWDLSDLIASQFDRTPRLRLKPDPPKENS